MTSGVGVVGGMRSLENPLILISRLEVKVTFSILLFVSPALCAQ